MLLTRRLDQLKWTRWQADAALLLITLIWGWTFVVMKDSISRAPVFNFLAMRFGLAFLTLLPLVWSRLCTLNRRQVRNGLLTGLFLFSGYALQTVGLKYTTVAKSGFITGLYVVLVPILAVLALRHAPPKSAVVGLIIATLGLARLTLGPEVAPNVGDLLTLGGAVAYAGHVIAVGRFGRETDVLAFSALQILTVLAGSVAFSPLLDGGFHVEAFSRDVVLAALSTGVLATALVLVLQTTAQRFTTPTQTAVIFTMEPVFAVVFGYLLAGDQLTASVVVGGAMILIGMLLAELGDIVMARRRTKEWVSGESEGKAGLSEFQIGCE